MQFRIVKFVLLIAILAIAGLIFPSGSMQATCPKPQVSVPGHHVWDGSPDTIVLVSGGPAQVRVEGTFPISGGTYLNETRTMQNGDSWTLPVPSTPWGQPDNFGTYEIHYVVHASNQCGYSGYDWDRWYHEESTQTPTPDTPTETPTETPTPPVTPEVTETPEVAVEVTPEPTPIDQEAKICIYRFSNSGHPWSQIPDGKYEFFGHDIIEFKPDAYAERMFVLGPIDADEFAESREYEFWAAGIMYTFQLDVIYNSQTGLVDRYECYPLETEPTPTPVIFDQGPGLQNSSPWTQPIVGTVEIPSLGLTRSMREALVVDNVINQPTGMIVMYGDDVLVHQAGFPAIGTLEVGTDVLIDGVSYIIIAVEEMSYEATYAYTLENTTIVTCNPQWSGNVVLTLRRELPTIGSRAYKLD